MKSGSFCRTNRPAAAAGYTVAELMVAGALAAIAGLMMVVGSNFCLNSFSRTIAVNVSHDEARSAVAQLVRDLHGSLSLPQLVDAGRAPVSGTGPAAGVSVQKYANGPFEVRYDALAGTSVIQIHIDSTAEFMPEAGQMAVIPSRRVEETITGVGAESGGAVPLTIANPLTSDIIVPSGYDESDLAEASPPEGVVLAYITRRIAYVVAGDELRYHPSLDSSVHQVIARGVTNPTPFSVPVNASGAPIAEEVAAANLSVRDAKTSNLNYAATNMFIDSWIPQRARITTRK